MNITTTGVLVGNTSHIYGIKNPQIFVCNPIAPFDWYTDNQSYQNNTLWGDGENKSDFDSCPQGWRVPTDASKTYGDFSITTMKASGSDTNAGNGRMYYSTGWFPAEGCRDPSNGVLGRVSSSGYYWSSKVNNTYAHYFSFNMADVFPNGTYRRAYGMSVRCVQE